MKFYLKVLKLGKPYLGIIAVSAVFMIFSTLTDGVSLSMLVPLSDKVLNNKPIILPNQHIPLVLKNLIAKANTMQPGRLLIIISVTVLILMFFKGIVYYCQVIFMETAGQRVIRDIRDKLFSKLQYMSMNFFSRSRVGELVSRMTYDVYVIRHVLTEGLADSVYYSFQLMLFLGIVLFINLKLALIILSLMPLISFPLLKVGKRLRKISKQAQVKMGDLNSRMQETFISMNIVKAFSMENKEIGKFKKLNQDFYRLMLKTMRRTLVLNPATEFVSAIGGICVLLIGGKEVIQGENNQS